MHAPIGRFGKSGDRSAVGLLALLAVAACAGSRPAPQPFPVPAMADGPLEIRVVYPPPQSRGMAIRNGATVTAASSYTMPAVDSVFLFGSVGRGDASLTVNGRPVDVYPTGAWLAWLPRPEGEGEGEGEGVTAHFHLTAWTDSDTVRGTFTTAVAPTFSPPPETAWIDPTAFAPAGELWVRPGEGYQLSVRASAGAVVRAILGDGDTLNFQQASPRSSGAGSQVVGAIHAEELARREGRRYVAWHVGSFGPDPGHVMSPTWRPLADDSSWVTLEVIRQADTARSRWPLRVGIVDSARPPLALVADDTAGTGATDRVLAGRPVPFGTYHWFFPNGTVIPVSGRSNAQVRLQLSRQSVAWVDASDVLPVRPGTPLPRAVAGSMRLVSDSGSVTLRVPLSRRVPFRVDETERSLILRLYGSAADMDWIRYGGAGPFVRLVSFHQTAEDEVEIRIDLDQPVWGYRTRWSGNALLLQIRRPPAIEQGQGRGDGRVWPFRGRRIAIDAGHPPAGSLGPTGITEAEVTLAVSRKLRSLLEERGADVVMIRDSELALGLVERSEIAERSGAELLVSIHANALADGANPFASSGTTVFYYHPRSVGLARGINDALVRQLGFRDLGVARGDLHLARPTWMPAVLVEGLFMMIPEHEAVLLSEEGQWRYAHGVLEGIGSFLEERAGGGGR